MAETKDEAQQFGTMTKAGMPMRANPGEGPKSTADAAAQSQQQNNQAAAAGAGDNGGAAAAGANAGDNGAAAPGTGLNEQQVRDFLKTQGIEGFESMDDLKSKITKANTPAPIEPTAEEKLLAEKKTDKEMLDLFVDNGGSTEQYVLLKQLATIPIKDLSLNDLLTELKEAKFSDDEIKSIVAERYYAGNPDELPKKKDEQGQDESDEDFAKRKELRKKLNTYYGSKLENRSSHRKSQAEGILKGLRDTLQAKNDQAKAETVYSSTVDEFVTKLPRKINLELGQVNNKPVDPVPFEIDQEHIDATANLFKDPSKRKQFFFNPDDSLNLTNVGQMYLENLYLKQALKKVYLESGNRTAQEVEKVFPGFKPHELGVGGVPKQEAGEAGKIVKAGKPQAVRRQ